MNFIFDKLTQLPNPIELVKSFLEKLPLNNMQLFYISIYILIFFNFPFVLRSIGKLIPNKMIMFVKSKSNNIGSFLTYIYCVTWLIITHYSLSIIDYTFLKNYFYYRYKKDLRIFIKTNVSNLQRTAKISLVLFVLVLPIIFCFFFASKIEQNKPKENENNKVRYLLNSFRGYLDMALGFLSDKALHYVNMFKDKKISEYTAFFTIFKNILRKNISKFLKIVFCTSFIITAQLMIVMNILLNAKVHFIHYILLLFFLDWSYNLLYFYRTLYFANFLSLEYNVRYKNSSLHISNFTSTNNRFDGVIIRSFLSSTIFFFNIFNIFSNKIETKDLAKDIFENVLDKQNMTLYLNLSTGFLESQIIQESLIGRKPHVDERDIICFYESNFSNCYTDILRNVLISKIPVILIGFIYYFIKIDFSDSKTYTNLFYIRSLSQLNRFLLKNFNIFSVIIILSLLCWVNFLNSIYSIYLAKKILDEEKEKTINATEEANKRGGK